MIGIADIQGSIPVTWNKNDIPTMGWNEAGKPVASQRSHLAGDALFGVFGVSARTQSENRNGRPQNVL